MVITLDPDLESALNELASRQGVAPEVVALSTLRAHLLGNPKSVCPRDEWERRLLALARPCGVSLPNSALSREALYE
jgi:hypothetical protein